MSTVSQRAPVMERIADRTRYENRGHATPCRIYLGSKDARGYGLIGIDRRTHRVHRVAYRMLMGEIPDGLELDHLCRQHDCCEVTHLEAVTHRENVLRGRLAESARARAAAVTHCPRNHPYSPENTQMKRHRDGYLCRACKQCHRERENARYHRKRAARALAYPALLAACFIWGFGVVPSQAATPATKHAAAPITKLAPPVPCTMANRLDIFIDEDFIMYACECRAIVSIHVCQWQVIGGVDDPSTYPIRRKLKARYHFRSIPRLIVVPL